MEATKVEATRSCNCCEVEKDLNRDNFTVDRSARGGLSRTCKSCDSIKTQLNTAGLRRTNENVKKVLSHLNGSNPKDRNLVKQAIKAMSILTEGDKVEATDKVKGNSSTENGEGRKKSTLTRRQAYWLFNWLTSNRVDIENKLTIKEVIAKAQVAYNDAFPKDLREITYAHIYGINKDLFDTAIIFRKDTKESARSILMEQVFERLNQQNEQILSLHHILADLRKELADLKSELGVS